ncbi:MAG: HAD hydrolase-like protein [Clostridia bacterium]|nr:HAD hydrolase-like protein [Clostridia bacterium]
MLKYVLFDLDGTVSDTSEGILNGYLYAWPRIGLPVPADKNDLRFIIGPPLPQSLMAHYGLSEELAMEGLRQYRSYYGPIGTKECIPYPGMPELLRELRAAGLTVMTATSKAEPFTRTALEHLGLSDAFDFLGCADMENTRVEKEDVIAYIREHFPDINGENTVMVGDRVYDVVGAHLHGLPVIHCTYGFVQPGELEGHEPDYTVHTVEELRALLISMTQSFT